MMEKTMRESERVRCQWYPSDANGIHLKQFWSRLVSLEPSSISSPLGVFVIMDLYSPRIYIIHPFLICFPMDWFFLCFVIQAFYSENKEFVFSPFCSQQKKLNVPTLYIRMTSNIFFLSSPLSPPTRAFVEFRFLVREVFAYAKNMPRVSHRRHTCT